MKINSGYHLFLRAADTKTMRQDSGKQTEASPCTVMQDGALKKVKPPAGSKLSASRQVNDSVLTDVQGNGQIGPSSDISPPYPSQRSISLPAGNKAS